MHKKLRRKRRNNIKTKKKLEKEAKSVFHQYLLLQVGELQMDTSYSFALMAFNKLGESSYSGEVRGATASRQTHTACSRARLEGWGCSLEFGLKLYLPLWVGSPEV
jgi:hypothetical protein